MFAGATRIDGRQKVTGDAHYGSDFAPGALAWAFLKTSEIAKGRIVDIDERAARRVAGVLEVLSYRNVGEQVGSGKLVQKGYMGSSMQPLRNEQVLYAGQIVAVVVAESFEGAREAARLVKVRYAADTPAASFDDAVAGGESAGKKDPQVGDFDTAFARSPIKVDARYATPTQHHNPIELFSTVAAWDGGKLTIWESSQNVWG
ncbi:MAG TPA: molybdopterin cofactor-binding domain-containing protein, partial [Steroidobacteraceae bacterium]